MNFKNFDFFQALGWFGNIILSISIIPQVYQTYKTHDVDSFNWSFILMWAFGVLFTFIYIINDNKKTGKYQYPLLLNYLVNIIGTFYLVFAKFIYS